MKSLVKIICHFPHGITIAKDFTKASVNSIIDNIQFPLFLASLTLSLRAQCEWNLRLIHTKRNVSLPFIPFPLDLRVDL